MVFPASGRTRQSVFTVAMVTLGIVVVAATTNSHQPEKSAASADPPSGPAASSQEQPGGIAAGKAEVLAMTMRWKGERFADGRPKVPDAILERMKAIKIAHAWRVLRGHDYHNQFEGGWKMLHPDKAFVGRALTAAYVPSRPDLEEHVLRVGKAEKRIGRPNS